MEIKKKLTINSEFGLHARPATDLVKLAQKFQSNMFLYRLDNEHKKADCKSVLSILLLGANKGTELMLCGHGVDAHLAIEEISNFFDENLN
jgi:phosphocarrier protein